MSTPPSGIKVQAEGPFLIITHLAQEEARTPSGIYLPNVGNVWRMAKVKSVGLGVDTTKVGVIAGDIILVNADDGIDLWGDKVIREHMVYARVEGVSTE